MKLLKSFKLISIVVFGFVFSLSPAIESGNFSAEEIFNIIEDKDILIIFNSGGWGNTPIDKAYDFKPVMEGIQRSVEEWGYSSIIIPYKRTKEGLSGGISGTKDFLSRFRYSSDDLAGIISIVAENFPEKKIIIAGLSEGAGLVSETMKKIPEQAEDQILAIAAGKPFWIKDFNVENLLYLDNNKEDFLTKGDIRLALCAIQAPFNWLICNTDGKKMAFATAFEVSGHNYSWSSENVGPEIISFLENRLR
jgi:hypothetical protein